MLAGLGIEQAFGAGADFSGINGVKDLKISSVAQINQLTLGQVSLKHGFYIRWLLISRCARMM